MREIVSGQVRQEASGYQREPLNLAEDFTDILHRGCLIDTYSSNGGVRVVKIVGQNGTNSEPLLGYGQDTDIEGALSRARDTYRHREATGRPSLTAGTSLDEWLEAGLGISVGGNVTSLLDGVAWVQGFRAYQEGGDGDVVVQTKYGGSAVEPIEGRGPTLEAAADELVGHISI